MTESTATAGNASKPWKSILSVLAFTRFSDWLASHAAPSDQPDGTVARPSLTARVLQAASRAGGAAIVTAVLSQAKDRNRRLSAIRTAIGPPGSVAKSVSPANSPGARNAGSGADAATRPDRAMQAATGAVSGLMDSLSGVSSADQQTGARDKIAATIRLLEVAQAMPDSGNIARPQMALPASAAVPLDQGLPGQSARHVGRVESSLMRAKAFVTGRPLLNSQQAAESLNLSPAEFDHLHQQTRVSGHVANSADGPLFEPARLLPDRAARSAFMAKLSETQRNSATPHETSSSDPLPVRSGWLSRAGDGIRKRLTLPTIPLPRRGTSAVAAARSHTEPNAAGLVVDQLHARSQPTPPSPVATAMQSTASRWLGPVAAKATGIGRPVRKPPAAASQQAMSDAADALVQTSPTPNRQPIIGSLPNGSKPNQGSQSSSGVTSTASVPPAASAGSRPSGAMPSNVTGNGGDGGDGSRPPGGGSGLPPNDPPDDPDDDEDGSPRRASRRRNQPQQGRPSRRAGHGSRHHSSWLREDTIMMFPRFLHRPLRQLRRLPSPSRRSMVTGRRKARQAMAAMSRTRAGAGVLRLAGKAAPVAGRFMAGAVAGGGGAAMGMGGVTGAAGVAGAVIGGATLAASFAGLAALIMGTVMLSLKGFADRVNESNRHLSQYNGYIATAFGQLDIERHHRGIKTGYDTQGTSVELTNKINRMEDSLQPIQAAWSNFSNTMAGFGADIVTGVATAVTTAIEGLLGGKDENGEEQRPMLVQAYLESRPLLKACVDFLALVAETNKQIAENTKKDDGHAPLGLQTLMRLENPHFQHPNQSGNLAPPNAPLPAMWENTL
jgi:hypothetical protein